MSDTTPNPVLEAIRPTDAQVRTIRTAVQGAAVTVLAGVALAAADAIGSWTGADLVSGQAWAALGVTAGTAAVHTLAAYIHAKVRPPVL